ncbi:MAG: hypothetical protein ACKO7G_13080 [Gammaproteobacteria bacterium]
MTSGERDDDRRQGELILKSRRLREQIAQTGADVTGRLGGGRPMLHAARAVTRTSVLIAAGVALLVFAGPRRALRLASRGLVAVDLARRVLGALGPGGARRGP